MGRVVLGRVVFGASCPDSEICAPPKETVTIDSLIVPLGTAYTILTDYLA